MAHRRTLCQAAFKDIAEVAGKSGVADSALHRGARKDLVRLP
jgi:hypothetical protein